MSARENARRRQIAEFMVERGLKIKPWCVEAGIAESGLRNYLQDRTASMTYDSLDKLALAAQTTVAEMVGEKLRTITPSEDIIAIKSLQVGADDDEGFVVVDDPLGSPFYFRREWIERRFDQKPENLRVITCLRGDGMMPTLADGDVAIVALMGEDAKFRSGSIYAIWDGHDMVVKRLESIVGEGKRRLRIISDNVKIFDPYEVDAAGVKIIGRIAWRGGPV